VVATAADVSRSRLAIVTEMGKWSPSTRYRALQHEPRLRRRFASVEVSLPRDPQGRRDGRIAQARYFAGHAAHYAQRGLMLPALAARVDAMLVQRGLYVLGPGTIVHSLARFHGRVVYDLDDAVFEPDPALARKGAAARWLYGGHQAQRLLRRADAVVVSTERLAEMLPPGVAEVTVMPTVPDVAAQHPVRHQDGAPVVIGWAGTIGGIGFLDPLRDVLRRLADDRLARSLVVSSAPWSGPADFHRWTLEEEHSAFNRFSIGIMPLPHSDYTQAKAGFKLLQYMAAGLPVVSSSVGVNVELIRDSGAGLLADSASEWEDALRTLAADGSLRATMGARGRAFVERYADLDAQADTLTSLLTG
jgi:glycosyltransferase involved in cell wall biosynthesis